jgi:hypothetical protein
MNWQIHPLQDRKRKKERRIKRISRFLLMQEMICDPKGARQPFLGLLKRSLQEIAICISRKPLPGKIPPLKAPTQNPSQKCLAVPIPLLIATSNPQINTPYFEHLIYSLEPLAAGIERVSTQGCRR